ncbi:MAG: hypothetical protein HYR93_06955 [Chloroflexi bacterium]|nr:hypothetical protein [Chloroflexota bacterium]
MLFSDFSALGSRPVTLEIYQGDKLVGKTSSTGGNAMIQFADPTQELKQQVLMALTMQNAGCLPSIEFNWDSSHAPQIQLPGSSQPESATKLRLIGGDSLLGDPDCKGTAFSSEGLTAGGISEFEITREQVHRL